MAGCAQTGSALSSLSALNALSGAQEANGGASAMSGDAVGQACETAQTQFAAAQTSMAGDTGNDEGSAMVGRMGQVRSAAAGMGSLMARFRPMGEMMGVQGGEQLDALNQTAESLLQLEQAVQAACGG